MLRKRCPDALSVAAMLAVLDTGNVAMLSFLLECALLLDNGLTQPGQLQGEAQVFHAAHCFSLLDAYNY